MITGLVVRIDPRVDVDMLILNAFVGDVGAEVHVVELLAVHVVDVAVAFDFRGASNAITIKRSRDGSKLLDGLDECELIPVAGCDDVRVRVLSENLCNEASGDLHLSETVVNTAVDWWAVVAFNG